MTHCDIWPLHKAWDHYKALSLHPIPTRVHITESGDRVTLTCQYTFRDFHKNQDITTENTFLVDPTTLKVEYCSPYYATTSKHRAVSPSGNFLAEIVQVTENGDIFEFLQITRGTSRLLTLNLTSAEKHGRVKDPGYNFGRLCWEREEQFVSYVAEASKESVDEEKPVVALKTKAPRESNRYSQSWGEKLGDTSHTVLCIVEISSGTLQVIDSVGFSSASHVWGERMVACVQYSEDPYRLGLSYCQNRGCRLMLCRLDDMTTRFILEDCSLSIGSLAFGVGGLYYLATSSPGPHRQPQRLHHYDLGSDLDRCLLEESLEFSGIYTFDDLCPTLGGLWAVLSSERGFQISPLLLSLEDGRVFPLESSESFPSIVVLASTDSLVVAALSSPSVPPRLGIGRIRFCGGKPGISWTILQDSPDYDCGHTISRHLPHEGGLHFESMLMKPKGTCPLVVFAHGGPHSCYSASFSPLRTTLLKCGFALLMVNYRGSTGYGGKSIRSLLGRIGVDDVADVEGAISDVLRSDPELMVDSVHFIGGSHGGFIGAHLIGQHPGLLRSACLMNPVINPASMSSVTDIPDWCFWECGGSFDYGRGTPTDNSHFDQASALRHLQKISPDVGVCLLVGGSDRRVPPSQGLEFYHKLRANSLDARLYYYPNDGHALNVISTAADVFCNNYLTILRKL